MKKLYSLVFALFLTISAFGSINIGGLEYDLNYYSLTASVAKQNGASSGTVVIPSTVSFDSSTYDVVSITDSAFLDCNVVSVTIPNSVNSIGKWAFGRCRSLATVNMPATLNFLGEFAFFSCASLESLVIPQGVTTIPDNVCGSCNSLRSVVLPDGVTAIGEYAFAYCDSLSQVNVPSSINFIAMWAFAECSFTSFVIPDGIGSIELRTFSGCDKLTSVTIPESVTSIGDLAFSECSSLQQISLPDAVNHIGEFVFSGCSALTSIVIPNGVPSLSKFLFNKCSSLASIFLPASISSIDIYAFADCYSLSSIVCMATVPPSCASNAFNNYNATLYVPYSAMSAYQAANIWQNFTVVYQAFSVQVNANDSLMGTVTGSGSYDMFSTATLSAMPKADYAFTGWSDGNLDNPRSLVVSSDSSVSAIFAPRVIDTVTVEVEVHDSIYVTVYDTIINMVHDTIYITLHDTITEFVHDTIFEQVHDTIYEQVYDTIIEQVHDTIYEQVYDTIIEQVHDTIYEQIYDTVYLEYNGGSAMVYSLEDVGVYYFMGRVINTQGIMVYLYSADGKFLKKGDEDINMSSYAPGIYIATDGNGGFMKINHVNQ